MTKDNQKYQKSRVKFSKGGYGLHKNAHKEKCNLYYKKKVLFIITITHHQTFSQL